MSYLERKISRSIVLPVISLLAMILLFAMLISCDSDVPEPEVELPILPPTLGEISPYTGSYDEIVTIEGDHFGDDIEKVKVSFNKIYAVLKSVSNKKIEAIVPEQNGTTGLIRIFINDTSELLSPREFKYTYASTNPVTVLDVDLTSGSAGDKGTVEGGIWEDGWKVTASENQRIVYDCGYDIANGYVEVTFTIDEDPFIGENKANYLGGYGNSGLKQELSGDKFYARSGHTKYAFSRIKAYYKSITINEIGKVLEKDIGTNADWKVDGTTLHTVRFSWKKGEVFFDAPNGDALSKSFNDFDAIRYLYIGTDKTYGFTIKGQKFKSIKVVDLGRL